MSKRRIGMEVFGFVFGMVGLSLASVALYRIDNLEKKLKQFDVIPREFDSEKEQKEDESE
jgi:hypothetical protein